MKDELKKNASHLNIRHSYFFNRHSSLSFFRKILMESQKKKDLDLEDRLIDFAVKIIKLVESLPKTKAGNHIAAQLVRCGTSPAPNYGEARDAESRADFIHKMKICLKELRETRVWLLMIKKAELLKITSELDYLIDESDQLISIFVKSIKTAKTNKRKVRS